MIVCIEGPSGAGKSTLAGRLAGAWENFQLCPTVDWFLSSFPVCQTEAEIERNFSEFIEGEAFACDFMHKTGGSWIQDRNWVSQLTFLEAIELLCGTDLRTIKVRLIEWLESGRIGVPSTFIYLRCPPGLTAARRLLRRTTEWGDVPPWVVSHSKSRFRELRFQSYEDLFQSTFPEALVIDSEGDLERAIRLKGCVKGSLFRDRDEIVLRLRSRIFS